MSNVRLATGGTWKTDTKEWRPKGGRGFYEKQRRPIWRLVPVCVLIAVAVASLTIKRREQPKHKPPKLHHLAPPIADPLVRATLDLGAGADARLVLTNLLSEEDRSYLNQTPTDMRGRAKGRMSAADRALVLALLGRPGGSYPVWKPTSAGTFVSLHAIAQTQLRRQHRVDGVGRSKFDFHTDPTTPARSGAYVEQEGAS